MQLHFVRLHDVEPALRRLAEAGLTTREACGNSVRNVTACPYAGVAADEVFDVTPYAEALTRHFLRHPLCVRAAAQVQDRLRGLRRGPRRRRPSTTSASARVRDRAARGRGFRVTRGRRHRDPVRVSARLLRRVPARRASSCAWPRRCCASSTGSATTSTGQRNRMKFLIKSLGWDALRSARCEAELAAVRAEGGAGAALRPGAPARRGAARAARRPRRAVAARRWPRASAAEVPRGPGPASRRASASCCAGRRRTLAPGRAPTCGRRSRPASSTRRPSPLPLGDLDLGAAARAGRPVRAPTATAPCASTRDQNLRPALGAATDGRAGALPRGWPRPAGPRGADAGTIADVTSCPGAESCRLAVTQSRGLGRLLATHLRGAARARRPRRPTSTSRSAAARTAAASTTWPTIGFQGSVRKVGEQAVPQYFVLVGGGLSAEGARFGRLAAKIPARRVPQAVDRLVALYLAERQPGRGPRPSSRACRWSGSRRCWRTSASSRAGDAHARGPRGPRRDHPVPHRHAGRRMRGVNPTAGPPRRPARLRPLHRLHALLPGAGGADPALGGGAAVDLAHRAPVLGAHHQPTRAGLLPHLLRRLAGGGAPQRGLRRAGGLGAGPLPLPRPLAARRAGRPALRAAHRGRRASPSPRVYARTGWIGRWLEPLGIQAAFSPLGRGHRAHLHRPALRGAHGAAGAGGRRAGARGGGRGAGGLARPGLPAGAPARRSCRPPSPASPWPSPAPSASTARWSSSPATCRCAPRSRRSSS